MLRIIERFTRGKRPDQSLNEDGLVVTDDFAAVIDGVTSKSARHLWQPSGGVVAARIVMDAVSRLSATATMRQAQAMVDRRLRDMYQRSSADAGTGRVADDMVSDGSRDDTDAVFVHEPWERLQANAVVYSAYRHEAWLFGDCQIMVNGVQTPTVKRVDELMGDLRAFVTMALRGDNDDSDDDAAPEDTDPARAMLMPLLRLQSRFANRRGEYGYFVFDGFTDPTYPVRTVPINPGDEVVLASDGYPLLRSTLAESEHELRRLRRDDPRLITLYRSTKGFMPECESFDDRTYLRFVA